MDWMLGRKGIFRSGLQGHLIFHSMSEPKTVWACQRKEVENYKDGDEQNNMVLGRRGAITL